jgi:general stress protein 26
MKADSPDVVRILRRAMVARIATLSRNRRPHVNPLYFVYLDGRVQLGTVVRTLAALNVRATPQVTILFNDERRPSDRRVLRLRGRATVSTDPEVGRAYRRGIVRKYFLNWRGLAHVLIHTRSLSLMQRYHATHGKGEACVIDVVAGEAELLPVV